MLLLRPFTRVVKPISNGSRAFLPSLGQLAQGSAIPAGEILSHRHLAG